MFFSQHALFLLSYYKIYHRKKNQKIRRRY